MQLDMSPEEFRRAAHEVVDWMADYLRDIRDYPVLPKVEPGTLLDRLPAQGPEAGEPMEAILRDFRELVVPGLTHWNHPRFFGYFSISGAGPGILGEMLAAALNVNGMLWMTSPAVAELEQTVLAWLRQWMGLPEEMFGIIYDTASVSTMHAIAAAREMIAPEARQEGEARGLTLYTSEHAHSSVEKGAMTLGIGQRNIRKIACDAQFRIRPDLLEAAIEADLAAGKKPFCVVPTVGTTSITSIDPVEEIGAIARKHGLWLHVDCAYGGAAAVAPEHRDVLRGVGEADSLVVNPHKWLFTPVDISILYTRRKDMLRKAFALTPAYLETAGHPRAVNYSEYGLQLGRRFRALKLWFVFRYFGREKIAAIIRSHIQMAQALAEKIAAHPEFEVAAPVPFSLICFRHKSSDARNRAILKQVNDSGVALLSPTVLNGQVVIRLAIGNIRTTQEDLDAAWEAVQRAAAH